MWTLHKLHVSQPCGKICIDKWGPMMCLWKETWLQARGNLPGWVNGETLCLCFADVLRMYWWTLKIIRIDKRHFLMERQHKKLQSCYAGLWLVGESIYDPHWHYFKMVQWTSIGKGCFPWSFLPSSTSAETVEKKATATVIFQHSIFQFFCIYSLICPCA